MDLKRKPYKIEIWEDKWIEANPDSPEEIKKRGGYWTEIRSVRIGDSENTSLSRAFNPILVRNVNGEITLTFSIYGYYYEEGQKITNFLAPYLFNEAKIKLQYDNKWYDFIIKDKVETHDNKGLIYEFSCSYLPMVELSKNGWNLSFSLDQENCIGTIDYFTDIILNGTDWKYVPDSKCNLTEYNLEYIYGVRAPAGTKLIAIKDFYNDSLKDITLDTETIIYTFFSDINSEDSIKQVLYLPNGIDKAERENNYTLRKGLPNYKAEIDISNLLQTSFYGYRVVQTNKTIWEPELSQYVTVYKYNEDIYYGYDTTEIEVNYSGLDNNESPDLTATSKTITKFYKKNNNEIYKLPVLGGYGRPKETGIEKQIYIDTESKKTNSELLKDKLDVYVYRDGSWKIDSKLEAENYPIGEESIVYYSKEELSGIEEIKLPKAEKQRSLVEEKSNRFNLIQKLAELFEVWAYFEIEHEEDGRIKLDQNTLLPEKKLTFKTEFGEDNYAGFSYDLNISSIKRTINSDSLATIMYVEKVDNENSKDGICSIQTANYNIAGELFIINLEYYAQVGLIDGNKLLRDLYGTTSTDFGYLVKLGQKNKEYTDLTEELDGENGLIIQLEENEELKLFYKDAYEVAKLELDTLTNDYNSNQLTASEKENYPALSEELKQKYNKYKEEFNYISSKIDLLNTEIKKREEKIEEIKNYKNSLNEQFYKMYSRFLQEGTWQGSDYIDPNAYYYDANQVALESSRPSIEYDISVYDISQAIDYPNNDTYELYNYNLGDITYIEDIEFFGKDENGTPYREQVIVSEIENNLDSPQSNKITIQNYKTRFEDLFQRTTATVQSYNLNKNVYERASIIEATGEINYNSLQNTLANNNFVLSQSKTNSVIIDNSGIEVLNLDNYRERVRIVSGGIFVSNDGGVTWNSGITGAGINTAMLLAGRIDAEKINILNGSFPTFAWDKYGINAFSWQDSKEDDITYTYDAYNSFIRFDQFGIYGIRNSNFTLENPFYPSNEYNSTDTPTGNKLIYTKDIINNIRKHSQFSLTWDGFNLKTNNGSIQIDSKDDIQVFDSSGIERVKLGVIGSDLYGLRLSDSSGNETLRTTSEGNLSLTGKMFIGGFTSENLGENNAVVAIGSLGTEEIITDEDYYQKERRILIQKQGELGPEPTFVVYEDGGVYIAGGISADFGNIGGFEIQDNRLYSNTVSLGPEGIFIYTKKTNINEETGESYEYFTSVFNATSGGDLLFNNGIANNLTVNNGNFNNVNISAYGSFNGTLEARNGLIIGSLILGNKVKSFKLSETSIYNKDGKDIIKGTLLNSEKDTIISNIKINNYYFVQTNLENSEEIYIIKLLDYNDTDVYFEIFYNKNYNNLNDNIIKSFIDKQFYLVSNNIVLDGQSGDIYTFDYYINGNNGYSINADGTIKATNLLLGTNSTIKVDNNGININIGNGSSSFTVDNTGALKANNITIYGDNNNYIKGTVYVGSDNTGIALSANGTINNNTYRNSAGADGWTINNDGSAIFNDVTVRGRIQTSTFVQNEIQALSGVLVVRPTITFKDNSIITSYQNEDGSYTYTGQINELLSSEHDGVIDTSLWSGNYYKVDFNGTKYFFIATNYEQFSDNSGGKISLQRLGEDNAVEITSDILNEFVQLPFINIGNKNNDTIGICINATDLNSDFGFPESITIYDENITSIDTLGIFNFDRINRLVMGRLPYNSAIDIPDNMRGTFGFYADNVYLKGAMVSATGTKGSEDDIYMTSGISTKEENGNIFWAGALGDSSNDILDAPFRVTKDGSLYAKKGIFEGEVRAALIRTAALMGNNEAASLRILNHPDNESSITFEQYKNTVDGEDLYNIAAKLNSNNFIIAAPLTIFGDGNIDSNNIPSLLSFNTNNIGINKLVVYGIDNKIDDEIKYYTSGWSLENNILSYRKIQNDIEGIDNPSYNYKDRISQFINTNSFDNIFEVKVTEDSNNNIDKVLFNYNNSNKIIIEENGINVYNNLILSNYQFENEQSENNQCSFKVVTEIKDNNEIVIGYNLFIEET